MSKAYILQGKDTLKEISLEEVFPFLKEPGHVISIVGGGGKTTLLYAMADISAKNGFKTLVTTTTHIGNPVDTYSYSMEEVEDLWRQNKYAVVGKKENNDTLGNLSEEGLSEYLKLADNILIESDGARKMACKVPNETEPVIIPQTDIVVGVMGLEVIGKTLKEACFRLEEACDFFESDNDYRIKEEDMVKILISPSGTKKSVDDRNYYIILNKCDSEERKAQGLLILTLLRQYGEQNAALTCFRSE